MEAKQNPFFRSDTLLGVCQALGDDLGINPLWLRIPLASAILITPAGAFAAYFGLAVLVLLSRLVFPSKKAVAEAAPAAAPAAMVDDGKVEQDTRELAEAA